MKVCGNYREEGWRNNSCLTFKAGRRWLAKKLNSQGQLNGCCNCKCRNTKRIRTNFRSNPKSQQQQKWNYYFYWILSAYSQVAAMFDERKQRSKIKRKETKSTKNTHCPLMKLYPALHSHEYVYSLPGMQMPTAVQRAVSHGLNTETNNIKYSTIKYSLLILKSTKKWTVHTEKYAFVSILLNLFFLVEGKNVKKNSVLLLVQVE